METLIFLVVLLSAPNEPVVYETLTHSASSSLEACEDKRQWALEIEPSRNFQCVQFRYIIPEIKEVPKKKKKRK